MRDAVNVGATALEELSDGDDATPATQGPPSRGRPTPIRGGRQNSSRDSSQSPVEEDTPNGQAEKPASSKRGGTGKARKSQVDLLKTLAVEWRGENGVERLENRLGKPLKDIDIFFVLKDFEKEVSQKAALVKGITAANEYCAAAFASANDKWMLETVTQQMGGNAMQVPRAAILAGTTSHSNESYGSMAVYMRLNGLVPPSTERAQAPRRPSQ